MTRLSVAAALFLTVVANAARADVEKKFSYQGQDAYSTFLIPHDDGCTVASVNVLTHDIQQRIAGDRVRDKFTVLSVDASDTCTGNVLMVGYAENIGTDGEEHEQLFTPQQDTVRVRARLILQDSGSFTFFWATFDVSWTLTGPASPYDLKDYFIWDPGTSSYSKLVGKGFTRAASARGTLSIVPYFPDQHQPYIGTGRSFTLDTANNPPEYAEMVFYSEQKQAERILYRRHPPASMTPTP